MKRSIYFLSLVVLFTTACNNASDQQKEEGAVFVKKDVVIPASCPFTVSAINPIQLGNDSLQSYALAVYNGLWFIVGGRTNGFHGTGGPGRTFPSQYENTNMVVYNPTTKQVWTAPLPAAYTQQLSATNMEYIVDGNTFWLAGGYGCTDSSNKGPCYDTYPLLTAIDLPGMIAGIQGNQSNLGQYITLITDNRFQVTGGSLKKLGNYFYLVMGQAYDTIYVNGITGRYTEQLRKFQLSLNNNTITVSNYTAISDPQFHRRDLNVTEAVRPNGQVGLNVLAGVFQPNAQLGLPWPNPVLIDQDASGNTTYKVDTTFSQNFNAYDCGHVLMYDSVNQIMYTALIGGITNLVLDSTGKPAQPSGFLPFSQYVSTVAQYPNGVTKEFPQASPLLPGFIGASGDVIVNSALPIIAGTTTVINYSLLPAGDNLVGWMYGGIISTAEQTNAASNPSFASATIYEIHVKK